MLEPRVPTLVLASVVLVAACTPAPEAGATAAAKTEPAPAKAAEPATAKAAEPATAKAEPTAVPSSTSLTLRAAAVREGDVQLLRQRDAPLLVLDGEPVMLVDGAFARHPVGSAGLWATAPLDTEQTVTVAAASLEEPLGTWVAVEHEAMRSWSSYAVYRRDGQAWQQQRLQEGLLVEIYSALVERDGALLALRGWTVDPTRANAHEGEEGAEADAYQAEVDRALERAKQEWVRIAGSETAAIPEIPEKVAVARAVTMTADGSLVALAQETRSDGSGGSRMVLTWRAGQTKAERAEVPGLDDASLPMLGSSGDWTFVGGATDDGKPYLALGPRETWEPVPVSLPGRPTTASVAISGAARLPDGELWIALGDRYAGGGDLQPVWRKPVEGPWEPVALPPVEGEAFGPAKDWVRDGTDEGRGWVATERPREPFASEQALGLVSAGGAVWIVVQGRYAYPDVGEAPVRTVVLTTAPGTAPPVVLPSEWALALERRNHALRSAKPGRKGCESFTIALGPAALAEGSPTLAAAVATVALEEPARAEPAKVSSVYVAKRGAGEVLVAEARAGSPARAAALREAVVASMAAAGVPTAAVTSECRIPALERMIAVPEQP